MNWIRLGAWLAAAGVVAGAFGAHALKGRVDMDVWETASRYHLIVAVAMMAAQGNGLLLAGVTIFSGSLYLLALTGVKVLGAITPIGGLLMIAGFVKIGLHRT